LFFSFFSSFFLYGLAADGDLAFWGGGFESYFAHVADYYSCTGSCVVSAPTLIRKSFPVTKVCMMAETEAIIALTPDNNLYFWGSSP
jgi:hypothetical protein